MPLPPAPTPPGQFLLGNYRELAGSQAPAWEPLFCKLLLGRSSGSRSFKNPIPKRELGNEQQGSCFRPYPYIQHFYLHKG